VDKQIKVNWTGSYPNLCSGVWEITIDGMSINDNSKMQNTYDSMLKRNMGTEGSYESWHFENWSEVFESYDDGLYFDDWVKSTQAVELRLMIDDNLIQKQTKMSDPDMKNLFSELQNNDWRSGSCGGCI